MTSSDDQASRVASENARDKLNRQIQEPLTFVPSSSNPAVDKVERRQDRPSYRRDPSTIDGRFRWD